MSSFQFEAIGTLWQIDINETISQDLHLSVKSKIEKRIENFDKTYSRFKDDSWVKNNAYKTGEATAPDDFEPLYSLYQELNQSSGGVFTPLIGSVMEQAGYDSEYTLTPTTLITPPPLSESIQYSPPHIQFLKKILLDFGAAGKGYLIDIVGEILKSHKISNYCIDASGDLLYENSNKEPLRVGLEHPDDPTIAIGVCELINGSICGSAGNRRKWGNFHHTINPNTLTSPTEVKATWIIAKEAILADGLATCLILDPNPSHYNDFQFEYVLLYKDNTAIKSKGFSGTLFT